MKSTRKKKQQNDELKATDKTNETSKMNIKKKKLTEIFIKQQHIYERFHSKNMVANFIAL